jgi:hypothetical protein
MNTETYIARPDGLQRPRALPVHVEHHVRAGHQPRLDLGARRAVIVLEDARPFQELVAVDHLLKLFDRAEMIVHPVRLSWTRVRVVAETRHLHARHFRNQPTGQRRLSRARRARDRRA